MTDMILTDDLIAHMLDHVPAHLRLERKDQANNSITLGNEQSAVLFAPLVDADYWLYRVIVGETNAVLGFPKYSTIGIGMAVEEDWNTNLPYLTTTTGIYEHIKHNAEGISMVDMLGAINLIRHAAYTDRPEERRQLDPVKIAHAE